MGEIRHIGIAMAGRTYYNAPRDNSHVKDDGNAYGCRGLNWMYDLPICAVEAPIRRVR